MNHVLGLLPCIFVLLPEFAASSPSSERALTVPPTISCADTARGEALVSVMQQTSGYPPRDEVNVRDLGAVPDDDGDDTAAIQRAVDTKKPLFFPSGVYHLTGEIRVSGTFHIRGPGAVLSTTASTGSVLVANGDLKGVSIRDIRLETRRINLTKHGGALIYVDYQNVDGVLIDNVTFDTVSSASDAILFAAQLGKTVKKVTIRNCYFTGPSGGIQVVQHVDAAPRITTIKILENTFRHNGRLDDQYAGMAISLSGPHNGIEVVGNDIRDYPYAGIEIVAGKAAAGFVADYAIHRNRILNCGRGLIIDKGSFGSPKTRMSRVSIIGNTIVNNRFFQRFESLMDSEILGNHVEASGTTTSPDRQNEFVSFRNSDRVAVLGNSISIDFPAAEREKSVVTFVGFSKGNVADNTIRTTGVPAIRFDGEKVATTDNVVIGNTIIREHAGAFGVSMAFTGLGATRNVLVDNVIRSDAAGAFLSNVGGNEATGTRLYGTNVDRSYPNDYLVQTVTGHTDLSKAVELKNIRLQGSPREAFTVVLPSRDGLYTISNRAGQVATITAVSGRVTVPSGSTAIVVVSGGVASLF